MRGSRWYEHQEPLDDRAVAPDRPEQLSDPAMTATGRRRGQARDLDLPSVLPIPAANGRFGRQSSMPPRAAAQGVPKYFSRDFSGLGVSSTDPWSSSTGSPPLLHRIVLSAVDKGCPLEAPAVPGFRDGTAPAATRRPREPGVRRERAPRRQRNRRARTASPPWERAAPPARRSPRCS